MPDTGMVVDLAIFDMNTGWQAFGQSWIEEFLQHPRMQYLLVTNPAIVVNQFSKAGDIVHGQQQAGIAERDFPRYIGLDGVELDGMMNSRRRINLVAYQVPDTRIDTAQAFQIRVQCRTGNIKVLSR